MLQNLLIILFLDKKINKIQSDKILQDLKLIVLLLLIILLLIHIVLKSNKMKTLKLLQENLEDLQIPIILLDQSLESIGNILIVQNCKVERELTEKNQLELEQKYL